MDQKYIQHIARKLDLSLKQVDSVHQMNEEGATIPFMARYRKEATGNLDEVAIGKLISEFEYFGDLAKRKETVIKTIEGLGKLSIDLRKKIEDSFDVTELEDLYLPFKPKRKTRALQAIEKGLEPLARMIMDQRTNDLSSEASRFITDLVKDAKEAMDGARDIVAEWISEDLQARNKIRQLFNEGATVYSKVMNAKKNEQEAQKYRDYFDYHEQLSKCPSHRILAIRRGEKEGFLSMDLNINKQLAVDELSRIFIKPSGQGNIELKKAIEDSFDRLLKPSIENEFRLLSKNKADEDAIEVFSENLRQLLLASPLGSKRVLAIDPGFRTGCKVVCLDAQGKFLYNTTIYPHPPQNDIQTSIEELKLLVKKYQIEAIGIGNGTAGRETEQLVRSIDFGSQLSIFQVNESGASIYSASEVAREEFPDQDLTVRGAISIGRRLLDPLSELVKIDPKSIGVGQYQHDVSQVKLKEALDRIVESAVNYVGVDVNTASRHLLQYVSGISSTLAGNIVQFRSEKGRFRNREELRKVSLMGPKSFEQSAGFLRISDGTNPLDNSSVHPESYHVVEAMASDLKVHVEELIRVAELRKQLNRKKYISESVGEFTIEDILKELEKPGRDPRSVIEEFQFDESIKSMEDLKTGMVVPGLVTNITNFGVFVDIGVKQDGMVHISQLSNTFISDPNKVVKLQQKVRVKITEVDIARKRIALSMKEAEEKFSGSKLDQQRPKLAQAPNPGKEKINRKEPDSFQSKLAELKKKFDK